MAVPSVLIGILYTVLVSETGFWSISGAVPSLTPTSILENSSHYGFWSISGAAPSLTPTLILENSPHYGAPIGNTNFECSCHDLKHINCSWKNKNEAITEVNVPVLKICHNDPCSDGWEEVECNASNAAEAGKTQYCFFEVQDNVFFLQVFSNDAPQHNYVPSTGLKFRPRLNASPPPPESIMFTSAGNNYLNLSWKPPEGWSEAESETLHNLIRYQVQYGSYNSSWIKDHQIELPGLIPYTMYCVKIRAKNYEQIIKKFGSWSNEHCYRTTEAVPSRPKHVTVTGPGPDKLVENEDGNLNCMTLVTTSWTALGKSEWNGIPSGYRISFCHINGSCKVQNITSNTTKLESDLPINDNYDIYVQAFNSEYMSLKEDPRRFSITNVTCPTEPPIIPGSVKGPSFVVASAIGVVLSVFALILFVRKYWLKTNVTSDIKGPIPIPQTNIGSLKFRIVETETYSSLLDTDPNPSYIVSPFDKFELSDGIDDEDYDSLRQHDNLLVHDNQLGETTDDGHDLGNKDDLDTNSFDNSNNTVPIPEYLEFDLESESFVDSISQVLISNKDLTEDHESSACGGNYKEGYEKNQSGLIEMERLHNFESSSIRGISIITDPEYLEDKSVPVVSPSSSSCSSPYIKHRIPPYVMHSHIPETLHDSESLEDKSVPIVSPTSSSCASPYIKHHMPPIVMHSHIPETKQRASYTDETVPKEMTHSPCNQLKSSLEISSTLDLPFVIINNNTMDYVRHDQI